LAPIEHGIVLDDLKGFRNYGACGRSKCVDADPEPLERTQRIDACHGRERERLGSLVARRFCRHECGGFVRRWLDVIGEPVRRLGLLSVYRLRRTDCELEALRRIAAPCDGDFTGIRGTALGIAASLAPAIAVGGDKVDA
jgi:hypothetical protein